MTVFLLPTHDCGGSSYVYYRKANRLIAKVLGVGRPGRRQVGLDAVGQVM
jgi:hypothetical protein